MESEQRVPFKAILVTPPKIIRFLLSNKKHQKLFEYRNIDLLLSGYVILLRNVLLKTMGF